MIKVGESEDRSFGRREDWRVGEEGLNMRYFEVDKAIKQVEDRLLVK